MIINLKNVLFIRKNTPKEITIGHWWLKGEIELQKHKALFVLKVIRDWLGKSLSLGDKNLATELGVMIQPTWLTYYNENNNLILHMSMTEKIVSMSIDDDNEQLFTLDEATDAFELILELLNSKVSYREPIKLG